jgi:diguanylate cyclase (GGDEF)-like protein
MAREVEATKEGVHALADTVASACQGTQVYFVYVVGSDLVARGDSRSGDDIGTGSIGIWLIQKQCELQKAPIAFNMRDRRVEDFATMAASQGREYLAVRLPLSDASPAEMLIMKGAWSEGVPREVQDFVEALVPPLQLFLERMLNAAKGERERNQMVALANSAQVLTASKDMDSMLEKLATATSSSLDYELVSLDLWDEATKRLTGRVINGGRWEDSPAASAWKDMIDSVPDLPALESATTRQPVLMPDAQNDERIHEAARRFWALLMVVSTARFPLIFNEEVVGTMGLASWRPRSFPPEEVQFLQRVATQVATAIKAMQMYKALADSEEQLRQYSEQLQSSVEIQHQMARTDALTGIPNRRYVEEVMEAEFARALRNGTPLSIVMADVDGLKRVNDEHGHQAGDDVLIQLARLARTSCRKADTVARFGGDEFLFVLAGADLPEAERFAERFRLKVERQNLALSTGKSVKVKASLGAAQFNNTSSQSASDLISLADSALYTAKSAGGNTTRVLEVEKRVA